MPAIADSPARAEQHSHRARTRGFSVAELLSAIVVLAVGILGVVALYVDRVHEQTRNPHTIASALAEEMADRIRSRGGTGTASRLQIAPFCTQPAGADDSVPQADSVAQDAACWQDKVARALPNGAGMVEREQSRKGYRITVSWSEAGVGAASFVMHVE
ncbi:MAG TPA: hypothetical protein VJS42_23125 [Steroidobacteraceae bacterium]|nr:hypothetical protein [Steroidobacteraceae bacterium]